MKYPQFERLVLAVGGVLILATGLLSAGRAFDPFELAAQLLLFVVVIGAVHWGRRGGLVAAAIASLAYIALRAPLVGQIGLTADVVLMLLARIVAFAVVGIVGGELCARIMYVLAGLDDANAIDHWSGVYNQQLASRCLMTAIGRCRRYGEPFCVVTVALSESLTSGLTRSRQRALVHAVADHIRGDLRMVDEVSRLEDGRFLILLPHSPKEGGAVVESRVGDGVRRLIGACDEAVVTECLAYMEDAEMIDDLLGSISTVGERTVGLDSPGTDGLGVTGPESPNAWNGPERRGAASS